MFERASMRGLQLAANKQMKSECAIIVVSYSNKAEMQSLPTRVFERRLQETMAK